MKEKGISLIALIITIIVIIILAAISIAGVSGVVERSRYAKFCGDIDAVQDAVSQAYGNKLVEQSLASQDQRKTSDEIYKWVAGGDEPKKSPIEKDGKTLVELEEGSNSRLGIDLPTYGNSKWYVDVDTGEIFLDPGFEYDGRYYMSKADIQNGGSQTAGGGSGDGGGEQEVEPPKEEPTDYTKYYVYINDDEIVDGIIFADLAIGSNGRKEWGNASGKEFFSFDAVPIENLKQYYIKSNSYEGPFGDYPVLALMPTGNEGKEERFYVMALEDVDSKSHTWYQSAYNQEEFKKDYQDLTSQAFGAGKSNTEKMLEVWNANRYGEKKVDSTWPNFSDVWGVAQEAMNQKKEAQLGDWFVPSLQELIAFANAMNITKDNYSKPYGLKSTYWPSSIANATQVRTPSFQYGYTRIAELTSTGSVRLATTF